MDPDRRFGLLMAGTTALLWGFLAIALKVAVADVDVPTIVWFRFTFAFTALALIVGRRRPGRLAILKRPPPLAVLAGACLLTNYLGFISAVDRTTPSNAQVLIQVAPLLLAGLGVVCFGERLARAQLIGVALAVGGFALFHSDQLGRLLGATERYREGNLMVLGAAVAWAGYAVLQKLLSRRGHAPQDLNLVFYALPALVLLPVVRFEQLAALTPGGWVLMVFLGLNTLVAYGALGEALKRLPAHEVSLVITLNPLITLVTMAILGALEVTWIAPDRVGPVGWIAALAVVSGVIQVLRHRHPATAAHKP